MAVKPQVNGGAVAARETTGNQSRLHAGLLDTLVDVEL
jgi:hypothetical protein